VMPTHHLNPIFAPLALFPKFQILEVNYAVYFTLMAY
jgi:hypothetical protein